MRLIELAKVVNGTLLGQDTSIESVCIDSRQLVPGQLFIAVKGDMFDGHDYLAQVAAQKAVAAVVSKNVKISIPTLLVEDTRRALGQIASYHRNLYNVPIISVTGSCGKTTTKTMIASILSEMGPTLAPEKSYNNEIGVPLTLLQLTAKHQYAVIEMGANHPGEVGYLSSITRQNVAMITNVAPAHLEGFKSIEGIAKGKGEIYQALSVDGTAVINNDDLFFDYWQSLVKGKQIITFGINNRADVTAKNIVLDETGRPCFDLISPIGKWPIHLPILGKHNVMNALGAIAATMAVGANQKAIDDGLKKINPVTKRLVRYRGHAGSIIIDDTYNANPLSVSAALDILVHGKGEKIFVFGDMGELGVSQDKFHIQIGEYAKKIGIDKLFACGKLSTLTVSAFGDQGFHFNDQQSLIEALRPALHENATVLVKGSRSSRMENIVEAIIQGN